MGSPAVLHITSLPGGGVDRHVRDISRSSTLEHLVWHAADGADVIEAGGAIDTTTGRFTVLAPDAIERDPSALIQWLESRGVGLVHAHSVNAAVRKRAQWAAAALGVPTLVTVHDILFLRREGFEAGAPSADPAWLAQTAPFIRSASAVLAPSDYIAELARANIPGVSVDVVPNGSPPPRVDAPALQPREEFSARRPRHVVAVLGAIGPHKGSRVLDELSPLLEGSGIGIVIIGYHDAQLASGWRGNVFVHGPYDDADVTALLRAYGAELALFPNQVPESFSYALSDVWSAGLPAIVPPDGALRERVARHGGGWILPDGFGAADVDAMLRRLLGPEADEERARVRSQLSRPDAGRVPPLDAMARSLDALYARFGIDPKAPVDASSPAAQQLLATSLDGALFRQELARILDEMRQMKEALERSLDFERRQSRKAEAEAKEWIAKLEGDIAALNAEIARQVEARNGFEYENVQLKGQLAAFQVLPEIVRKVLGKLGRNARS